MVYAFSLKVWYVLFLIFQDLTPHRLFMMGEKNTLKFNYSSYQSVDISIYTEEQKI